MHDALCVIKRTLESGSVVAGGGAVEVALSIYLENFATTLGSREQLAIAEFSSALLVIPKTLASNAAKDSSELVAKLRAYHAAAQASARDDPKKALRFYGLDLHAGQVRDNARAGVVEPLLSKVKSLKAAVRLLPRTAPERRDCFPSDRAMPWLVDQADALPSWKRVRRCCESTTASRSRPKSPPAGTTDTTTRFGDVCNGAVMLSLALLRLWSGDGGKTRVCRGRDHDHAQECKVIVDATHSLVVEFRRVDALTRPALVLVSSSPHLASSLSTLVAPRSASFASSYFSRSTSLSRYARDSHAPMLTLQPTRWALRRRIVGGSASTSSRRRCATRSCRPSSTRLSTAMTRCRRRVWRSDRGRFAPGSSRSSARSAC